ncbi:MAG TPA: tRNA-dihydrouridine synthase, partial [Bdellovibrio sp.]
MNPVTALKTNPFVLAPMAGITDHAFRTFMKKLDTSVVVTELVSANGIEYKSERTMKLMSFDETQRPIGIQLFGEEPEVIARAAQVAEAEGCDFVDLNFGCPVPKVVKKGAGSAMLKDPVALQKVLAAVKGAIKIPLTIKIRTGWDANTRNAIEVCNIAYNEGVEWVAIHGRTRAQGYSGLADWDFI